MSQDLAAAINDGLYDYEDELWDPSDDDAWVTYFGSCKSYKAGGRKTDSYRDRKR